MNVVVVSFDNYDIVRVLRAMTMIVVMVAVMVVMVVARIWDRRATVISDVAVHPIDMDVRSRPKFFLLSCCSWGAMFM